MNDNGMVDLLKAEGVDAYQGGVMPEQSGAPAQPEPAAQAEPAKPEPAPEPAKPEAEPAKTEPAAVEPPVIKLEAPEINYAELSGGKANTKEELLALLQKEPETYKTDDARLVDNWLSQGKDIKTLFTLKELGDVKALQDKDALAIQMQLENPSFSREKIETIINDRYRQTDEYTEDQKKVGALNMEMDGIKAKAAIADVQKAALSVPEKKTEATVDPNVQRIAEWQGALPNITKSLEKVTFDMGDTKFEYVPSADQLGMISQVISEAVKGDPSLRNTEEGRKALTSLAHEILVAKNHSAIMKAYGTKVQSDLELKHATEIHNPSGAAGTVTPAAAPKGKTEEDYAKETIAKQG